MRTKGEALVARGTARFNAGRPREALADLRAAFRLGADAAKTLRAALKRAPGHAEALRLLAGLKTGGGSAPKAFVEFSVRGRPLRVPRLGNLPIEVLALLAGVKPVIHCWAAEADLPAFDELCRRLRLQKLVVARAGRLAVFLGRDAAALKRTARLWDGERFNPGRSLGYPACCTRFYYTHVVAKKGLDLVQSVHRRTKRKKALPFPLNDVFYLYSRVPTVQSGAKRQQLFAKNPGLDLDLLNLIPWHPCSYRCAASLKKASAIWKTARKAAPELAGALKACLSRPVVFWDWDRFAALSRRPGPDVSYACVEPPFSLLEPRLLSRLKAADRVEATPKGLQLWKGARRLGPLGGSPPPILLDFAS